MQNTYPGGKYPATRGPQPVKRGATDIGSTVPARFTHNVVNNSTVPVGAGVVRRSITQLSDGRVFLNHDFYFKGNLHTVTEHLHTVTAPTVQGTAIPTTKLNKMMLFNKR